MQSGSSRPVLPMDIWNLLDEFAGVPPGPSARSRSSESLAYEVNAMDRLFTDWLWLTSRSREREEKPPERVDTAAVLRKCRKVVYKPSSSLWGKAKADADQSECPVCLEKLVAKDKLFMLPYIRRGPKKNERASAAINDGNPIMNFRQRRTGRGIDLRGEGSTAGRNVVVQNSITRSSSMGEEDVDAWEGLHEYIMAALAEVDAELNRFMR
ncbi:hypothetical protein GOP47_0020907 [Adiantum capillus-veneris]|uniref:Uncharacterized protein n=1 Tax=Adiantum capillus-veneris TaxID=13818 RepID=A0A9D4Z864_ADICA|nr:hypothetical protein GOP47_0020907 [Adiantum capillus-veneris]